MHWRFNNETQQREALEWLVAGVADIYPWLQFIAQQQERILAAQDDLDARSARVEAANVAVLAGINDLKAQVAAGVPAADLDFTRLDAAISGEEALEPAPAVDPNAPVVDPNAPTS